MILQKHIRELRAPGRAGFPASYNTDVLQSSTQYTFSESACDFQPSFTGIYCYVQIQTKAKRLAGKNATVGFKKHKRQNTNQHKQLDLL